MGQDDESISFGKRRHHVEPHQTNYLKQRNWLEPALMALAAILLVGALWIVSAAN